MYSIDLEKARDYVKKHDAKRILLQFPDGIKPRAKEVADYLKKETGVEEIIIWSGTSFGACDLPQGIDRFNFDLVLHFGHSRWKY